MTNASLILLGMLAIGAALWLAGHRILRWTTLLCGVICGAVIVNAVMANSSGPLLILLWIVVGGLAGAAVSWLLFRLIAGTSMAITLALLAMVSYTIWQQLPLPGPAVPAGQHAPAHEQGDGVNLWQFPAPLPEPAPASDPGAPPRQPHAAMLFANDTVSPDMDDMAEDPVRSSAVNASATISQDSAQPGAITQDWQNPWSQDLGHAADALTDGVASRVQRHAAFGQQISQKLLDLWQTAISLTGSHGSSVIRWWSQLTPVDHLALIAAALIAAIVGFILGLSMPYMAAAGQSALVGTALLAFSYVGFANASAQRWDLPVPQSSQQWLLLLILGTAMGLLLQWWIWAPRETAKKEKA